MNVTNSNWSNSNQYGESTANNNNSYTRYSRISIEDAMSIALEQAPGEVVKVELDSVNGILVYEVDILTAPGSKYEIDINAQTGRILTVELGY